MLLLFLLSYLLSLFHVIFGLFIFLFADIESNMFFYIIIVF